MKAAAKLDALYRAIPGLDCRPGCTDCCGVVPFAKSEWQRLPAAARRVGQGMTCPHAQGGRCAIYAQRPFMCRIFGAADDPRLACPHGCAPRAALTARQAAALTASYLKLTGDTPVWNVEME